MQHNQQEHQHHADMQEQCDRLDDLVAVRAQRAQQRGHAMREKRRRAVRQIAVVDRRTTEERVGPDDIEDHEQD